MTLKELTETFDAIQERSWRDYEFHASMQGVDLSKYRKKRTHDDQNSEGFKDRLRQRMEKEKPGSVAPKQKSKYSDGVGYKVIGG